MTIAAFSTSQIAFLSTSAIAAYSPADIASLSTAQVAALQTEQIRALGGAQIAALSAPSLNALSTAQIGALSTAQMGALVNAQLAALGTKGLGALSTAQIGAISGASIAALSTANIVALTTAQVQGLSAAQIKLLSTAQISAIETDDLKVLSTAQIAALTNPQTAALSTTQVAALQTEQIRALGGAQIAALVPSQIPALSTAQVRALSTTSIAAFETADLIALTTAQIQALSPSQVAAITPKQACALSPSQVQALTSAQVTALTASTPIVLDLNGDGVRTLSISDGVQFDLLAVGQTQRTAWVSAADGLLALDRNHDGRINDGSELFGSSTPLASGGNASDGYQALRELDSSSDGVISAADGAFSDLRVWVDAGSDGVSAPGELRTLESLGIVQLDLRAQAGIDRDNGNLLGLTSTYQTADGVSHAAADVWFAVDVRDTAPAVALETPADLASRTSLLCQAIGSFDDLPVSAPAGVLSTNGFASAAAPSGAAISLQGAMQQFYTAWGSSVLPASLAAGPEDLLKSARPPESGFAGLLTDKPS